jgi:D-alanyl-D-alanine carboxypeptidase (penicillin-binding protein 5/6)
MKKFLRIISLVCVISLLLGFAVVTKAEEPSASIDIQAKSAVLMEQSTGKVLFEVNSHEKLPPASVTKVMTMVLIMEAIDNGKISFDDLVTCSEYAASMGGSQVYLEPGEQMTVQDMLKAIAVASGNDASVAMAEHICGSEEAFVKAMNDKAKELGMNDTNFVNCNGLDTENHYTSAYDIALMSRELLKYPKIHDYLTIWIDSLREGKFGLANTNKLVRFYKGANGIKTGSTSKALYCLSASAQRDGMQLIATIMAAPTSSQRFSSASKLLDYGFAQYAVVRGVEKDEAVGEINVSKGMYPKVKLQTAAEFNLLVEKGKQGSIDKKVNIIDNVMAPVEKGQKVGDIVFSSNGEEIGKVDVVTAEAIEKITVGKVFNKLVKRWLNARN